MSDGLYVDYEELERTRSEVLDLLNRFNDSSESFSIKLQKLKDYWNASDYETMNENVKNVMGRIAGADGTIPNLMREVVNELEKKHDEYRSIQSSNASYWG